MFQLLILVADYKFFSPRQVKPKVSLSGICGSKFEKNTKIYSEQISPGVLREVSKVRQFKAIRKCS